MMPTVQGRHVDDDRFEALKEAGDFRWSGERLVFICPCGCGGVCGIAVKPADNGWTWNGDKDKPTTDPSIRVFPSPNQTPGGADPDYVPCKGWHGYLRNGIFETCE